jgi:hypothetical protein
MTTEAHTIPDTVRLAAYALAALGVWFVGISALTVTLEPTNTVVVFGRSARTVVNAAADSNVAIVGGSGRVLTVAGTAPGFVRQLYASGAWLVLPFSSGGCRDLSRWSNKQAPAKLQRAI